jgi:hypothetical protein
MQFINKRLQIKLCRISLPSRRLSREGFVGKPYGLLPWRCEALLFACLRPELPDFLVGGNTALCVHVCACNINKNSILVMAFSYKTCCQNTLRRLGTFALKTSTRSTRNLKKRNLGVKCGGSVGLTTLPPSVSHLSK